MNQHIPKVRLDLSRADAIVLFDWLMSVDIDAVPTEHPAQKQALMDLLTRFESDTDIPGVTAEDITAAQALIGKDVDW